MGIEIVVEDTGIGLSHRTTCAGCSPSSSKPKPPFGGAMAARAWASQSPCSWRAPWAARFASSARLARARRSRQTSSCSASPSRTEAPRKSATCGETGRVLLAFDRPLERRALSYALVVCRRRCRGIRFLRRGAGLEAAAGEGAPFDRIVIDGVRRGRLAAGRLARQGARPQSSSVKCAASCSSTCWRAPACRSSAPPGSMPTSCGQCVPPR